MILNDILTLDLEAGDLALLALPIGLDVQIHTYNFFKDLAVTKYPDTSESDLMPISIVRRSGHYDILYHQDDHVQDNYDFSTKKFTFTISTG